MKAIKKIVLTGGPCSGKTTIFRILQEAFKEKALFVPEIATLLINNKYPVPKREFKEWNQPWQDRFQDTIFEMQLAYEEEYARLAAEKGIEYIFCDRGLLDIAAYLGGGMEQFETFLDDKGLNLSAVLESYHRVIFLQSLASYDSENYLKQREEFGTPLERAQLLETKLLDSWRDHRKFHYIQGTMNIFIKIDYVHLALREFYPDIFGSGL